MQTPQVFEKYRNYVERHMSPSDSYNRDTHDNPTNDTYDNYGNEDPSDTAVRDLRQQTDLSGEKSRERVRARARKDRAGGAASAHARRSVTPGDTHERENGRQKGDRGGVSRVERASEAEQRWSEGAQGRKGERDFMREQERDSRERQTDMCERHEMQQRERGRVAAWLDSATSAASASFLHVRTGDYICHEIYSLDFLNSIV